MSGFFYFWGRLHSAYSRRHLVAVTVTRIFGSLAYVFVRTANRLRGQQGSAVPSWDVLGRSGTRKSCCRDTRYCTKNSTSLYCRRGAELRPEQLVRMLIAPCAQARFPAGKSERWQSTRSNLIHQSPGQAAHPTLVEALARTEPASRKPAGFCVNALCFLTKPNSARNRRAFFSSGILIRKPT